MGSASAESASIAENPIPAAELAAGSSNGLAPHALPSLELNEILQRLDLTFLEDRMLAMPTRYYVSVSVVCDIVCPFCPRQYYGDLVDNGVMNYDAFKLIAPHLKYADFAGMFGLGEPFLHKDFFNFLAMAKEASAFVTTNSHGMSLNEENCQKLIDSGLDEINCSMDGHNKELFEFLREGAVFEEVMANLKHFTKMKREQGVTKPELQIAVTISRHNVKHMADMVKLAKEVGADKISFSNLIIIDPDNVDLSVVNTPLFDKNLAKAKKLGEKYGIPVVFFFQNPLPWIIDDADQVDPNAGKTRYGCHEAWRALTVERRGDTKPCCYLEGDYGNSFEEPITELRNNAAMVGLRRELMDGEPNRFCRNCGNLRVVTHEHVQRNLADAERLLNEAPPAADGERKLAAQLLDQFKAKAAQYNFPHE